MPPYLPTMIANRKNSSPARLKAHSFARWLVLCVFLVAATNGSALEKLPAPTSTSELAAGEREAAIQWNFASNYNEQTDPELANALALTSGILGLVDLGASFSGVKNLANSTNKASDALQLINKSETALSLNHSERVNALVNKLEQGTHADVVATLSSVKAREFVEDVLEIERNAAQKAGKTDVVEQLDDALDVVRGSIGIDWIGNALATKLDGLNNVSLKQQFITDFADATGQTKALLNQNVDLVDAWKVVNYTELGTDINALQKIHTYIEEGVDVNLFKTDMDDILSTGSQTLKNQWLNTLGNDNYILLRRGTDRYAEISAFDQSGYVLSDAARAKYLETGDIQQALTYANDIHQQWLMIFNGDINAYAQAHASLGTAMESTYNLPRTLISFTSDNTQLDNFVSTGGTRFIGIFEKSNVTQQTLSTSSESEYLITSGLQIFEIQ